MYIKYFAEIHKLYAMSIFQATLLQPREVEGEDYYVDAANIPRGTKCVHRMCLCYLPEVNADCFINICSQNTSKPPPYRGTV